MYFNDFFLSNFFSAAPTIVTNTVAAVTVVLALAVGAAVFVLVCWRWLAMTGGGG